MSGPRAAGTLVLLRPFLPIIPSPETCATSDTALVSQHARRDETLMRFA